ncbi:MAG: hypothetical protein KatS3mg102_0351 [Planctomycetota bacterium]|nr:MAG: hypothetical protein KatS3mg102_0351 [Planctomycetota bacterium]
MTLPCSTACSTAAACRAPPGRRRIVCSSSTTSTPWSRAGGCASGCATAWRSASSAWRTAFSSIPRTRPSGSASQPSATANADRLPPRRRLYRQLLRLVYRLLFLLVSEDRGLISADPLYREHYGVARLRRLLERRSAYTEHDDLWCSLRVLWKVLCDEKLAGFLGAAAAQRRALRALRPRRLHHHQPRLPRGVLASRVLPRSALRAAAPGQLRRLGRRRTRLGVREPPRVPPAGGLLRHRSHLRPRPRLRAQEHRLLLHAAGTRGGTDPLGPGPGDRGTSCGG